MRRSIQIGLIAAAALALTGLSLSQEAAQETPAPQAPPPQEAPPAEKPAPAPQQPPAKPVVPVPQGPLVSRHTVPFRIGEALTINALVGSLRVPELSITLDEKGFADSLMPPQGGTTRFSYLRYTFAVENPGERSATLRARVTLLDKNNAVVDEFELDRRVSGGKAQPLQLRRITLNYALQYIDKATVTFSAE